MGCKGLGRQGVGRRRSGEGVVAFMSFGGRFWGGMRGGGRGDGRGGGRGGGSGLRGRGRRFFLLVYMGGFSTVHSVLVYIMRLISVYFLHS